MSDHVTMKTSTEKGVAPSAARVLDAISGSASLPSSNSASQSTYHDGEASPLTSVGGVASQSQQSQPTKISESQQSQGNASLPKGIVQLSEEQQEGVTSIVRTGAPLERRSAVPEAPRSRSPSQSIAGQKRLASGSIKKEADRRASNAMMVANAGIDAAAPSAERIREMASQLSTRLSYAYVKVKHGWETRNLDEVEILAEQEKARVEKSQVAAAKEKTRAAVDRAGEQAAIQAMREMGVASLSRGSSSLSEGQYLQSPGGASELGAGRAGEKRPYNALADVEERLRASFGGVIRSSRTYESFWRDHGSNSTNVSQILEAQRALNASTRVSTSGGIQISATGATSSLNRPASLAPPAPIVPNKTLQDRRRRRMPYRGYHPPPSIPAVGTGNPNAASDLSNMSSSTYASVTFPTTPPPRRTPLHQAAPPSAQTPLLRTPSDKTAMEQDAVETLVSLSSPVHATPQPRQAMYAESTPSTILLTPPPRRSIYPDDDDDDNDGGVDAEEELDRILDTMSSADENHDGDDEDDDDTLDGRDEDST
ncbi:MAG: hypothetical protein M1823_000962 [Watsoniomyces obsoletus]|nr:MAG: hypothetical protein M1823_000962 [Watsoniomyces obsoletus]